jgi:formylmethanofuran dehydrogenase subunit E
MKQLTEDQKEITSICRKCGEIQKNTGTPQNGEYTICEACNIVEISE